MLAAEIADYLEDRGIGTVGTDIFVGQLPTEQVSGVDANSGIFILASPSEGQHRYLDTNYEDLDLWAAHRLTETAYGLLGDAKDVLSRMSNYQTASYYIYFSHDVSGIVDMDRTRDGLKLFKMTIRFIHQDKNLIS